MYLTRDAVLAAIRRFAPGTELVMEYALPPGLRDKRGAAYAEFALPAAAERGEPWLTFLTPGDLPAVLKQHGIEPAEHVRQADAVAPPCGTAPTPCAPPTYAAWPAWPSPPAEPRSHCPLPLPTPARGPSPPTDLGSRYRLPCRL